MAGHSQVHLTPSRSVARWIDWLLLILAVLTVGLGIYGFGVLGPQGCQAPPWWFLDALYRTAALFEFSDSNLHIAECYPYPALAIARLTGPAATVVLVGRVLLELLREPLDRWRLGRFAKHTVVIGFGEQGQVRALEAIGAHARVVAIDSAADEAARALARRYGIGLISGDARQLETLQRARIDRAVNFVIATGDDARNLSIAQRLAELVRHMRPAERRIEVSIGDPLIRRALDSGATGGHIDAFAIEDTAAFLLCGCARFFEIADLAGQRRVHVVMVGFGQLGASCAAQILRSGATADLLTTRLSIVSPDPEQARNLLGLAYPEAEKVADIAYFAADPARVQIDRGRLMGEIEAADAITAILVLGTHSAETLPAALAVHEAARRAGRWSAPIFFGIEHAAVLTGFAQPIGAVKRLSQAMHPFEISAHLCTRRFAEQRDDVAKAIHAAYRRAIQTMRDHGQEPAGSGEAVVAWTDLRHTYRQANRRAADHIPAKLASAGCVVPRGGLAVPEGFNLLQDEGMLERLAQLEHRAWAIDRQLDGWRAGAVRDDARLIHDSLRPYEQLREQVKELDRAQIRELATARLPRVAADGAHEAQLVRFDLWVGLIGAQSISRAEATWLQDILADAVLAPLLAAHPEHAVTLVSPLAPGGDLIAARAALGFLAARKWPHRLLVVEAVRTKRMIEDFEPAWGSGSTGALELPDTGLNWPQTKDALAAAIDAVEAAPSCERIVELDPLDADASLEQRQAAYQRRNAYIVQRTHVLVAAVKQPLPSTPGGTGEAVAWRRDRSIMPATMPRYLRRPNRVGASTAGLVLIDIGQRKVREEPFGA